MARPDRPETQRPAFAKPDKKKTKTKKAEKAPPPPVDMTLRDVFHEFTPQINEIRAKLGSDLLSVGITRNKDSGEQSISFVLHTWAADRKPEVKNPFTNASGRTIRVTCEVYQDTWQKGGKPAKGKNTAPAYTKKGAAIARQEKNNA